MKTKSRSQTRRTTARMTKKTRVVPSAPLARAIRSVINKSTETKYVAVNFTDRYVPGSLPGDNVTRRLFNLVPPIVVGTTSHGRIGNAISPIKFRVTVQYYFQGDGLGSGQDLNAVNKSLLAEVRQFVVSPKDIKSNRGWTPTVATALQPKLLEVGDGTTINPDSALPINLEYKISDENFKPLKGCKKFIMGKNAGTVQQQDTTGYPLTTARAQNTLHFSVKCPKVFKYDDDNTDNYPSNFLPLFGCHAGLLVNMLSGQLSTTYDGVVGVLAGNTNSIPIHPLLRYNVRSELWYKDA